MARHYKDEHDLDYVDHWPPNSPDLDPIENVWRALKQRIKGRDQKCGDIEAGMADPMGSSIAANDRQPYSGSKVAHEAADARNDCEK
ncbi:MAG: hypothetical protein M1836_003937 [Candelina mexicana]|nr:MAG: hypothetical protein M1836_003937 [Candelina mexicana]